MCGGKIRRTCARVKALWLLDFDDLAPALVAGIVCNRATVATATPFYCTAAHSNTEKPVEVGVACVS